MAAVVDLTPEALRNIFPRAPQKYIDGLASQKAALDRAGITASRTRLAYCLANVEHECGGFTIQNLTENINYTHARAAQIWPSRFPGGAATVRAKYGDGPGWQLKMFDDVYGNRMGNRPGTSDGSRFIGRGACQHTGRDGYAEMQRRTGIPCVDKPELAAAPDSQAQLIAAFWSWKNMNPTADAGDFRGVRKKWNGGYIGIADVEAKLNGNDPILKALRFVDVVMPTLKELPGGPTPNKPPKEVVDKATEKERQTRAGGGAAAGAGTLAEGARQGSKEGAQAISPIATGALVALGFAVIIIVTIMISRKKKTVRDNWI